jgi:hypothetical protein
MLCDLLTEYNSRTLEVIGLCLRVRRTAGGGGRGGRGGGGGGGVGGHQTPPPPPRLNVNNS